MPLHPGTLASGCTYDGLGFATLAFNNRRGLGRPGTGVLKGDGKAVAMQRGCRCRRMSEETNDHAPIDWMSISQVQYQCIALCGGARGSRLANVAGDNTTSQRRDLV
jgi:hypothetical protein